MEYYVVFVREDGSCELLKFENRTDARERYEEVIELQGVVYAHYARAFSKRYKSYHRNTNWEYASDYS